MQILSPIVSSWVSMQGHRSLVQIIPEPFREFWDKWELRALVLLSLVSQLILLFVASRRKYSKDKLTKVLVWSAYMIADWVPTFAMGVISANITDFYDKKGREIKNDMNPQLTAFWAPFFLIHLGGPYSITAYALEDSELWSRHLVSLLSQSLLTAYIIILSWEKTTTPLTYLCVPMLIIGIIKYVERIHCLYSCRIRHLQDSLYVALWYPHINLPPALKMMLKHMGLFLRLYTGAVSIPKDIVFNKVDFKVIPPFEAYEIIRNELESMYNVLYTKKYYIVQSWSSIARQMGTFGASITVLVLYIFYSGSRSYSSMDHVITLVLLIHAVISDFIAQFIIVDFILRLYTNINRKPGFLDVVIGERPFWMRDSLEKCNLLSLIWKEKENGLGNYLLSFELLRRIVKDSNVNVTRCSLSPHLQEMIFGYFKNKTLSNKHGGGYEDIIRSQLAIQASPGCFEFYKTIIAWHLATNLFFYQCQYDMDLLLRENEILYHLLRETMNLSDHMLFLLMKRSYMLPCGTGLIIIHHTLSEARELFPRIPKNSSEAEAANIMLRQLDMLVQKHSTHQDESVLVEAVNIAMQLRTRENRVETWKSLAALWMEIVGYAAAHCKVENHLQQLRKGGEFLTQVWLLQAYFGLLDEFCQDEKYSQIPKISLGPEPQAQRLSYMS